MNKIKQKLVFSAKKLEKLGLNIGSEGNVSFRNNKTILITPSGIDTSKLDEKKISEVDLEGKVKNNIKPSSEILMHLFIYKKRPEIKSIVHCHSEWASIVSCQRQKITAFHYMIAEFGGPDIPCAKYATFGSKELAENVLNVIKSRWGCLIANHGQLTISESIEGAINLAISLEKLSKQFFFCKLSKKTKFLNNNEMNKVVKLFKNYKIKH